jgi:hypothetical protein
LVIPSKQQLQLRCGDCGGMDFGAHVEPLGRGGAAARELVCRGCRRVYRLRPDLTFERTGTCTNLKGDPMS